jgi:hypothetical protein
MGIAGSPDVLQGKMPELMKSLEYVQAYLDDLLCISRNSHEDHLKKKLDKVLRCLHNAGLKVNAEKLTFCELEIEYLGYILTRDGIKPQGNKVQAILAIQPTKGVKQLRHFLGIVQNYHDPGVRDAHPSHLIGWRVRSDQSYKSKRNQKSTLALGQGPSKSFQSCQGYYCKGSGLVISGLF